MTASPSLPSQSPEASSAGSRPPARRAVGRAILFLGIFLGLIGGAHAYFIKRLIVDPQWPAPIAGPGTALLVALGLLMCAFPAIQRRVPPRYGALVAWPAYLWMGTSYYLLCTLGLSDLLMWGLDRSGSDAERTRVLLLLPALAGLVCWGMFNALMTPRVRRREVYLPRWPKALDGYRLIQLSDIHIGHILRRGFAARVMERCNAETADLIAITGDVVDGSVEHLRHHVAPLGQLRAKDGVYFVTGNHDHYANAPSWIQHWRALGLHVLANSHQVLASDRAPFVIGGVYDRTSHQGDDVQATFANAPEHLPRLLLAHHPETFQQASQNDVDLQLSGHTHDGQMWPFRYLVHLQTHFTAGLYQRGAHHLYVSRGTGFWGPPLRVGAPSEITLLTLRSAPPPSGA